MRATVAGAILGVGLGLALSGGATRAQDAWPTNTVTLVTPYAAGGGSDVVTRILAEGLRRQTGQTVVVQNVVGAGGVVGMQAVARAKPDGYTLLVNHVGMATAPALYKDLTFDPVESFEPIGLFADMAMMLVAAKSFAPTSLAELVAHMRRTNGETTIASSGMGSATYLCALLFQEAAGLKATMVQYKGAAPALLDVQAGRVDLLCDVTGGITSYVKAGTVKAFMITSPKRLPSLPDLPTTAELGLPSVSVSAWYGVWTPGKTPQPVVARMAAALQAVTRDPAVTQQLATTETVPFEPAQATPEALRARLTAEMALWTPILRKAEAVAQ